MSTVDNGDVTLWMPEVKAQSYEQTLEFMQTYILPYLRYDKYYKCNLNEADRVCVQFLDGTVFTIKTDVNGTDIVLYLNGKLERNTRNYFAFQLNKRNTAQYSQTSYIEPYIYLWNGKVESLKQGQFRSSKDNNNLAGYCTKIIQLNGWKIPDDYPW